MKNLLWVWLLVAGALSCGAGEVFPVPTQIELSGAETAPFAVLAPDAGLPPDTGLPLAETSGFPVTLRHGDMGSEEAYRLEIGMEHAVIEAGGDRGTLYALMTLGQLLRPRDGQWVLPVGTVTDRPVNRIRAAMLGLRGCVASPEAVENFKQVLAMLGKLKYNTVYLDVSEFARIYNAEILRFPNTDGIAFSAEQVREILDYAKAWHLKVVPMAQIVSHGTWVLGNYANQQMLEDPGDTGWNTVWCWRHPRTKEFTEAFLEETLAFFGADEFHVMLDEILYGSFGTCPRCKDTPQEELMAEIIGDLHTFLRDRGARMTLFHDGFLTGEATFLDPEAQPNALTRNMPKDMLVNVWYYGDYKRLIDKQFDYYSSCGYELMGASFLYPSNIEAFAKRYRDQAGCMATYWFAMPAMGWVDFEQFNTTGMAITSWSAGYYWNPDVKLHGEVDFEPVYAVARHLYGETPVFAAPVPVALPVNRELGVAAGQWPGRVHQETLPQLPANIATPVGTVPYAGLAVVSGLEGDGLPVELTIPVGRKLARAAFLHASGVPSNNSKLYAHGGFALEPELGYYRIQYADGSMETIPLRFRREIVDWNSRLDAARERRGWGAMGSNRLNCRLGLLSWENPHPEKEVTAVVLHSAQQLATPIACAALLIDEIN